MKQVFFVDESGPPFGHMILALGGRYTHDFPNHAKSLHQVTPTRLYVWCKFTNCISYEQIFKDFPPNLFIKYLSPLIGDNFCEPHNLL